MKGHIRQRGRGVWAIVVDAPPDPTGCRRQKWITVHSTKKEAERELARILHEMNTGMFVEPSKLSTGEYLERWLHDYARSNVSAKTFERYSEIVRLHLKPALGGVPLAKLQPLHIQGYYSHALECGRRVGKGGLSARTVLHHHRLIHNALEQAVRWRLLIRNPADAAEPPKADAPEIRVLTEDESAELLRFSEDKWLFAPILIALGSGMRRGEILALRWQDIDLKTGRATVTRSLQQTDDGLSFKSPKTAKGRRVVVLPAFHLEGLRRHRIRQAEARLLLGPEYVDKDLICALPDGEPIPPDRLSREFRRLARRAGYLSLRFHDLRHTHASQLLKEGVNPKLVSERLGHSRVGFTLDTYAHLLPDMQEDAARRLDIAMRKAKIGHSE